MIKNTREFKLACRNILSSYPISSLRSYGRYVGLNSPTSCNKEPLIEQIVGVLSGEISVQERSGRGAPVLDERLPMNLIHAMEALIAKYAAENEEDKCDIPQYDMATRIKIFQAQAQKTKFVANSTKHFENNEDGTPCVFVGQLATHNNVSFLLPLDYIKDEEKLLLPIEFIHRYGLREGDVVSCNAKWNNGVGVVTKIVGINGASPEFIKRNGTFDELNVCYPVGKINVYDGKNFSTLTAKYMDWVVPFGRGQRALLVAAPKTGKTLFLQKVAYSVTNLNPNVITLVLLLDQSPEMVGQFRKLIHKDSLIYATYEDEPERQVFIADSILKRAKRLAECGKDVVLIVDSLSALARAFNETEESSGGKMLPCGLESKTVHYIKKYLGAARCLEVGGSLTILGAVSNKTGNPADDLLATELSSICNLQIQLKEDLAAKQIFPAVGLDSVYVKYNDEAGSGETEILALLRNVNSEDFGDIEMISTLQKSSSIKEFGSVLKKN